MPAFIRVLVRTQKGFLYVLECPGFAPGVLAPPADLVKATSAPQAGTTTQLSHGLAIQQVEMFIHSCFTILVSLCFQP